jgi:hypothetical protein
MWQNLPKAVHNTGNLILKTAFHWHDITRLKAYRQIDIEARSYRKPQEAQMTSTMVEYLPGIQTAKEATAPDKNRLGNLANNDKYFTRADDAYTTCAMCSNALWG